MFRPVTRLLVEVDEQGRSRVSGPLSNRPVCWSLIGAAIEALVHESTGEAKRESKSSDIVIPSLGSVRRRR